MEGKAVSNEHEVTRKDLPFEFMLNALRLKEGVTAHAIPGTHGVANFQHRQRAWRPRAAVGC